LHSLRASFGEFRYAAGIPHFLDRGGNDAGLLIVALAVAFCVVGVYAFAVRRPEAAAMLVLPLGFMLIAWGLHKYPTLGRTQLFLLPAFALLLGAGIVQAVGAVRSPLWRSVVLATGLAVPVAIAVPSTDHAVHPRRYEDVKPVLAYLARMVRPNDTVFVYYPAQYALRYYLDCNCAGAAFEAARAEGRWPVRPTAGRAEYAPALRSTSPRLVLPTYRGSAPSNYYKEIDRLRGRKRVWLLVSNLDGRRRFSLLHGFGRRGDLRTSFSAGGSNQALVGAYLYDLRGPR
jgi:hypothetical protein